MERICKVMDMLYRSNKNNKRLSYKEFYNETVNTDHDYKKVFFIFY